jgi:outer membrane protein assembly factor BamB
MPLRVLLAAMWVIALIADRARAVIVYTPPDEVLQMTAVNPENAKEDEASARHMLDGLRSGAAVRAEELYALARKYPKTAAARQALMLAGDTAVEQGDLPAALTLYEEAVSDGAVMNEARTRRFDAAKQHAARRFAALPADLDGAIKAGACIGMLPCDAPWLGDPGRAGFAKFLPYVCGDRVIVASWKGVAMLDVQGRAVWNVANPKGPSGFSTERPNAGLRGAIFAPAVLNDAHGRPAIVVVRQPGQLGDTQYMLRAYRAADGKLLWSTENSEQRKDLTYAGLPAVCGRYVYSIAAGKTTERSVAQLYLSAVDVMDGGAMWQTPIGSITETNMRGARKAEIGDPIELEGLGYLSEPAVCADLVIASTNCGAVIAVDRFTGRLRWVHMYHTGKEEPEIIERRERGRQRFGDWDAMEIAGLPLARYCSTPVVAGKLIVVLPQDEGLAFGLDRNTGQKLWQSTGLEALTAVGACADRVILAGAAVGAIDPVTAKLKWRFAPGDGKEITGPATLIGDTVMVPVTGGLVQLSALDGKEKPVYQVPIFRRILASESGKDAINELGASKGFSGK